MEKCVGGFNLQVLGVTQGVMELTNCDTLLALTQP